MSYTVLSYKDVQALQDPEYLVDNVVPIGPGGSLGVLFGKPGTAKSFVALDLAHSIATGLDWHGKPTRRGTIVYIAAEGALGFKYRTRAWARVRHYANLPSCHYIFDSVDLTDMRQVDNLREAIIDDVPETPLLIVVDTLARSMGGKDENEPAVMGAAILGAQRLQTLGCSVLLVHHIGHHEDQSRPRGHSSLVGAADYMIRTEKSGRTVKLYSAKQKDADEFAPITLELVSVAGSVVLQPPVPVNASLRSRAS